MCSNYLWSPAGTKLFHFFCQWNQVKNFEGLGGYQPYKLCSCRVILLWIQILRIFSALAHRLVFMSMWAECGILAHDMNPKLNHLKCHAGFLLSPNERNQPCIIASWVTVVQMCQIVALAHKASTVETCFQSDNKTVMANNGANVSLVLIWLWRAWDTVPALKTTAGLYCQHAC